ncbi:hypothetical protein CALVIDRAFT_471487, partial [Calocera viscosa TUFC12733]
SSVEISDALFCQHWQEVCSQYQFDSREDDNTFYGLDPIDHKALSVPDYSVNKEGKYNCKKHGSDTCSQCYNCKKQITKLNKRPRRPARR